MRTERLKLKDISKEFFNRLLEPFGNGYDAAKVINTFWNKYTLHETTANLYILLEKSKESKKDLSLFKADYEEFIDQVASAITAHYFYFLNEFDIEEVDIPVDKTFYGPVYPNRRGFIDELNAIYDILSENDSTPETQRNEKETIK